VNTNAAKRVASPERFLAHGSLDGKLQKAMTLLATVTHLEVIDAGTTVG
jgi:hypothetical protein